MEGNGQPLPTIKVSWDAARQMASLDFDAKDFKTWDFVMAVLEMAKAQADFNKKVQQTMAMQQQAAAAQQEEAVKRLLIR